MFCSNSKHRFPNIVLCRKFSNYSIFYVTLCFCIVSDGFRFFLSLFTTQHNIPYRLTQFCFVMEFMEKAFQVVASPNVYFRWWVVGWINTFTLHIWDTSSTYVFFLFFFLLMLSHFLCVLVLHTEEFINICSYCWRIHASFGMASQGKVETRKKVVCRSFWACYPVLSLCILFASLFRGKQTDKVNLLLFQFYSI